jgi:hypothetical protein
VILPPLVFPAEAYLMFVARPRKSSKIVIKGAMLEYFLSVIDVFSYYAEVLDDARKACQGQTLACYENS